MRGIPFEFIQVSSFVIDAVVVACVFWAPWRRSFHSGPVGLGRAAAGALAVGIVFVVKIPFSRMAGVDAFGMLNLIYVDLAILVPGTGAVLLLVSAMRRGRMGGIRLTRPLFMVCLLSLLALPIGVFASFVEPARLQEVWADVRVAELRSAQPPLKVGVLADIQTDRVCEHDRRAVASFMAVQPELILIAGDLFQGSRDEFEREMPAIKELLSPLDAPLGVYFVMGDVDWWREDQVRRALAGTRVRLLVNEIVQVQGGSRKVTIGGVELRYDSPEAKSVIRELETAPGDDDLRILLAHRPDVAFEVQPDSRVDLVVAGHTHGGQVCVPFIGPLITLSDVPREIAAGGLHRMSGNQIYVTRGVGHERGQAPRIRFLCPPEYSILTISSRPAAIAAN